MTKNPGLPSIALAGWMLSPSARRMVAAKIAEEQAATVLALTAGPMWADDVMGEAERRAEVIRLRWAASERDLSNGKTPLGAACESVLRDVQRGVL